MTQTEHIGKVDKAKIDDMRGTGEPCTIYYLHGRHLKRVHGKAKETENRYIKILVKHQDGTSKSAKL